MTNRHIVIYGSGGAARQIAWHCESFGDQEPYKVVCFVDDNSALVGKTLNDIQVLSLEDAYRRFPNVPIISGIGTCGGRKNTMAKAAQLGFAFETIIHPDVQHSKWLEVDTGTFISPGVIIMPNVKLGQHVQINLDCTIGHDVILGNYTTLAPGVHISGWVHAGNCVYFGAGAVTVHGVETEPLTIADDTIIGAGAVVTKSITEPGLTWVGVPARPLRR